MFFRKPATAHSKKSKPLDPAHFRDGLYPVLLNFSPYLSGKDNLALSQTNHYASDQYTDEIWRRTYLAQRGTLYYFGDYKEQLLCAEQIELAESYRATSFMKYAMIVSDVRHMITSKSGDKNWGTFSLALLSENYLDRCEYAIRAFRGGYLRAAGLMKRLSVQRQWMAHPDHLQQFYSLLKNHAQSNEFNAELSIISAVCFSTFVSENYRKDALECFFKYLLPDAPITDSLFREMVYFFSRVDNIHLGGPILAHIQDTFYKKNPSTILATLYLFFEKQDSFYSHSYLVNYFKNHADLGNAQAAFLYAQAFAKLSRLQISMSSQAPYSQRTVHDIENSMQIAYDYYKKAFSGGCYDAGPYLKTLLQQGQEYFPIGFNEVDKMVLTGVSMNNKKCILFLADDMRKDKQWRKKPLNLWIIQEAARLDVTSFKVNYNFLMKDLDISLYHHCARAYFFGLQGEYEASLEHYRIAKYADAQVFNVYNAKGKELGLWKSKEHGKLLSAWESEPECNKRLRLRG